MAPHLRRVLSPGRSTRHFQDNVTPTTVAGIVEDSTTVRATGKPFPGFRQEAFARHRAAIVPETVFIRASVGGQGSRGRHRLSRSPVTHSAAPLPQPEERGSARDRVPRGT